MPGCPVEGSEQPRNQPERLRTESGQTEKQTAAGRSGEFSEEKFSLAGFCSDEADLSNLWCLGGAPKAPRRATNDSKAFGPNLARLGKCHCYFRSKWRIFKKNSLWLVSVRMRLISRICGAWVPRRRLERERLMIPTPSDRIRTERGEKSHGHPNKATSSPRLESA